MAQVLVTESYLHDIADAIRGKSRTENTYTPAQMAGAIEAIPDPSVLVQKSITANGEYDPEDDSADGYSAVTVNVPNTYSAGDEGKVVSGGSLVTQTSKNITANGTHNTTENNSVNVDVPNSYAASDEGKVVSSGALVSQTSRNVTANGTYDTTENNEVVVNVPSGDTSLRAVRVWSKSTGGNDAALYVQNGTYTYSPNEDVEDSFVASGEPISVLYTEVRGNTLQYIKFFGGLIGVYYYPNWVLRSIAKTISSYGIKDGEDITTWAYNTSINAYIGEYPAT